MDDMMFENFFKMFLNNAFGDNNNPRTETIEDLKCGSCGMSLAQFKKIGRLGCADCYQSLKNQLMPIIKGVQGGETHTGKIPSNASGALIRKRQLERLKKDINTAIQNEEYEKAAILRDQIKSLTDQEGGLQSV